MVLERLLPVQGRQVRSGTPSSGTWHWEWWQVCRGVSPLDEIVSVR